MAAFCSSLQFRRLMRVTPNEDWPVFVCLWAKCQRICCVCLSCQCSAYRIEVDTASGPSESARHLCQVTDPSGQVADCWSMDLTSVHPTCQSKKPDIRQSQTERKNMHKILCVLRVPSLAVLSLWGRIFGSRAHLYALQLLNTCQLGQTRTQRGVSCYLPKTQPSLQLILVIDILLAPIKTLRGCD